MSYEIELEKLGLKIRFTASSAQDVFKKAAIWHDVPEQCGKCGCRDLKMIHRQPQGCDFYELACQNGDCNHRYTYSETKESKQLYPRRQWEPPYSGEDHAQEPPPGHHGGGQQQYHGSHGARR